MSDSASSTTSLQEIDNLLNDVDVDIADAVVDVDRTPLSNVVLLSDKIPSNVSNLMWSFLLDEAPLPDCLTLVCKKLRNRTYNHPSYASRFHLRLEPRFRFASAATNTNRFQIGGSTTPATKRAIIIADTLAVNLYAFPFHTLKVFNICNSCQLKDVIPFFNQFAHHIKFMSWNDCKFLYQKYEPSEFEHLPEPISFTNDCGQNNNKNNNNNNNNNSNTEDCKTSNEGQPANGYENENENENENDNANESGSPVQITGGNTGTDAAIDAIPCFPNCNLFSLLTRAKWHSSVNLNGRFPNLLCFSYTIEYYDHLDLVQDFLDSHAQSLTILFLDFNFKFSQSTIQSLRSVENETVRKYEIRIPANVEILILSCVHKQTSEYLEINCNACRHQLKQLVTLENAFKFVRPMLIDGHGNRTLQYLVVNSLDDVHHIPWEAIQFGKCEMNQLRNLYVPCTPEYAESISKLCIGAFPDLEDVKDCIASKRARKMLRDLNCEQRRHWLWGMFWFERHGIGMKKLKILEDKWRRQQSIDYY